MVLNHLFLKSARKNCEAILEAEREDLIEKKIWPSQVKVIDCLLKRGLELDEAYEEISNKLNNDNATLRLFFDHLAGVAFLWNPSANTEARQSKSSLVAVNKKIHEKAAELAELLGKRDFLNNNSGFSCGTHYHPAQVIHAAAEKNNLYNRWVKERIQSLNGQFDLKYWPSLEQVVQAIADDAEKAVPFALDSLTEASTEGFKESLADTFKAFFVGIEESKKKNHGFLPNNFEITDRSVASFISCALDLDAEKVVDASYVKRLRQRQRQKSQGSKTSGR